MWPSRGPERWRATFCCRYSFPGDTVTTAAPVTPVARAGERMLPAYFLAGVLFGIVLTKGELVSWFRIQEALRFDGLYIYEVLSSAFVVATPLFWWLKRRRLRSLAGEPIAIPPKALGRGRRYVIGGAIFGGGWGLPCCSGANRCWPGRARSSLCSGGRR